MWERWRVWEMRWKKWEHSHRIAVGKYERKAKAGPQPIFSSQRISPGGLGAPWSSWGRRKSFHWIDSIEMTEAQAWTLADTHLCLALAVQYLRFLSGSFTWPSRQHCPHTNFIFKLRGRPLPAAAPSPTTPPPGTEPTPLLPRHSPPTPPITPGCMLPLWWGTCMGWNSRDQCGSVQQSIRLSRNLALRQTLC